MQALVESCAASSPGLAPSGREGAAAQRRVGKLSVQERLDRLLDRGTPWLEIAPLAARGMYEETSTAPAAGRIGVIHGREVLVHANDPMIKGGTVYPMGVKKNAAGPGHRMENRLRR